MNSYSLLFKYDVFLYMAMGAYINNNDKYP